MSFFSILSQPGRYKNGGHSKITLTKKRWVSGHKVSNFFQHQGRLKNVNIGVGRWLKRRDQNPFNVVSEWPQNGDDQRKCWYFWPRASSKAVLFFLLCRIIIYDILRPIVFDIQSLNSTTEVKTSGWLLFKHSPSWLKIPDNFQLPAESKHIKGAPVSCWNWKQIDDYFF